MVTTVSRVLASLAVVALLLVGAPLSPGASALAARTAGHAPLAVATAADAGSRADSRSAAGGKDSGSDGALLVERDSGAVSVALPGWKADHRPVVRDLPEAYSPVLPWAGDFAGHWTLVPPPGSVEAPRLDEAFALPFGRAPPLPGRM
ncbi:hypothetical protein [Streptomonospora wellingtoniae]|uniref:Uncharacterized protein n=1 Tax=Streptomonospora wellingtoniae TaxID=3075544 RepID=A0ABU2KQF0_9ACTN|nr:hypothetical protein [Streptomonospora sp. DSM 45055]MDT0301494.1 hypothetical protein [Streptomonospora sp. DSM 45055]